MKLKINKILIKETKKQIRNKKNKDEIKIIIIYNCYNWNPNLSIKLL